MIRSLLLLTVLAASSAALATPPRLPATEGAVGAEARAWLDLQKNGQAASAASRDQPGEVADKVYQRWLDSHDQPIPAQFGREGFAGGASGE
jgi:hypothetical protein